MVNTCHQILQGQPVTKPETPLQIILVGNVNLIQDAPWQQVQSSILKEDQKKVAEYHPTFGVLLLCRIQQGKANRSSQVLFASSYRSSVHIYPHKVIVIQYLRINGHVISLSISPNEITVTENIHVNCMLNWLCVGLILITSAYNARVNNDEQDWRQILCIIIFCDCSRRTVDTVCVFQILTTVQYCFSGHLTSLSGPSYVTFWTLGRSESRVAISTGKLLTVALGVVAWLHWFLWCTSV